MHLQILNQHSMSYIKRMSVPKRTHGHTTCGCNTQEYRIAPIDTVCGWNASGATVNGYTGTLNRTETCMPHI